MFNWALTFFVVALVAGLLGFGALAGAAATSAKIVFGIGLLLLLVNLVTGHRRGDHF
jgi:uncharacterized membrane protein YtjA (UPF0391 family)